MKRHIAWWLVGLTPCVLAIAASSSGAIEALDEVVASGTRERERQKTPIKYLTHPDVVDISRDGGMEARVQLDAERNEVRFRRESSARIPATGFRYFMHLQPDRVVSDEGERFSAFSFTVGPDAPEPGGVPALLSIGPRTSLVNIDFMRLATDRPTLINLTNALHPQSRRCERRVGIGDDKADFPNRFILVSDRFTDCRRTLESREGDLIFADSVPPALRQEIRDIYRPLSNRFATRLGSETGLVFVVWRPESLRNDFRLERGWSRTSLLLLDGAQWQKEIDPQQRGALWEALAEEQILRRVQDRPDAFTRAAADYLLLLARGEREHSTGRLLGEALPVWLSGCVRHLAERAAQTRSLQGALGLDCGRLLQFTYDAVVRAESQGNSTVQETWRSLLAQAYRRGEFGSKPSDFLRTSSRSMTLMLGLLDGSSTPEAFVAALAQVGVDVNLTTRNSEISVQVQALRHFRD